MLAEGVRCGCLLGWKVDVGGWGGSSFEQGEIAFTFKKGNCCLLSRDIKLTVLFPLLLTIVALKPTPPGGSKQKAHLCNVLAVNY